MCTLPTPRNGPGGMWQCMSNDNCHVSKEVMQQCVKRWLVAGMAVLPACTRAYSLPLMETECQQAWAVVSTMWCPSPLPPFFHTHGTACVWCWHGNGQRQGMLSSSDNGHGTAVGGWGQAQADPGAMGAVTVMAGPPHFLSGRPQQQGGGNGCSLFADTNIQVSFRLHWEAVRGQT